MRKIIHDHITVMVLCGYLNPVLKYRKLKLYVFEKTLNQQPFLQMMMFFSRAQKISFVLLNVFAMLY